MPRLVWPSWRWMTISGTPSRAISTACAWRSWCGAKRRRTPASRRPRGRRAATLRAAPAAPRARRRDGPRGRTADRHPAPARPHQPRHHLDLPPGIDNPRSSTPSTRAARRGPRRQPAPAPNAATGGGDADDFLAAGPRPYEQSRETLPSLLLRLEAEARRPSRLSCCARCRRSSDATVALRTFSAVAARRKDRAWGRKCHFTRAKHMAANVTAMQRWGAGARERRFERQDAGVGQCSGMSLAPSSRSLAGR